MTRRKAAPKSAATQGDLFGEGTKERTQPRARLRAKSVVANVATSTAPALLTVRQAAARLGLAKSTLDKMRTKGKGPRFVKSTDRAVRYDPIDLDAWVANRRRQSTTDA